MAVSGEQGDPRRALPASGQKQSEAIRSHQKLRAARGALKWQSSSVASSGQQWPAVVSSGQQWPAVASKGHLWTSTASSGEQRPPVALASGVALQRAHRSMAVARSNAAPTSRQLQPSFSVPRRRLSPRLAVSACTQPRGSALHASQRSEPPGVLSSGASSCCTPNKPRAPEEASSSSRSLLPRREAGGRSGGQLRQSRSLQRGRSHAFDGIRRRLKQRT